MLTQHTKLENCEKFAVRSYFLFGNSILSMFGAVCDVRTYRSCVGTISVDFLFIHLFAMYVRLYAMMFQTNIFARFSETEG